MLKLIFLPPFLSPARTGAGSHRRAHHGLGATGRRSRRCAAHAGSRRYVCSPSIPPPSHSRSLSVAHNFLTHPSLCSLSLPPSQPLLVWWHEATAEVPATCPVEWVPSEHPLFILYTSGSTGKPKGKERGKDEESFFFFSLSHTLMP